MWTIALDVLLILLNIELYLLHGSLWNFGAACAIAGVCSTQIMDLIISGKE